MRNQDRLKNYKSIGQKFKDEVIVTRAGEKWNITKTTREFKNDTDIIKVMKKYGCIDSLIVDEAKVFDDVTEIQKLSKEDYYKKNSEAKELWLNLPAELKARYNNNIETFITNAPTDLKAAKDKQIEQAKIAEQEQATFEKNLQTIVNNEANKNKTKGE